jgi:putative transposase
MEWNEGRNPDVFTTEKYISGLKKYPLHSQTVQTIVFDLWTHIDTARGNREKGIRSRAPWRSKNYRALTFQKQGWKETAEGKLRLSFGNRGRSITVDLPEVTDHTTGQVVPSKMWGVITLHWDMNAREWALLISYHATGFSPVPQAKPDKEGNYPDGTIVVAIDEGIINAMAATCKQGNIVEALVINGRGIRSIKQGRNRKQARMYHDLSRCQEGSRKHKRIRRAMKRLTAKTNRQLKNANHQVTAKMVDFIKTQSADKETGELRPIRTVVGDCGGVQQNTKKTRRAGRRLRQELSQWGRGQQETYLAYKLGVKKVERVPENHTTQACPECKNKYKPRGREYKCRVSECSLELPRDVVGPGNIGSRATEGGENVSKDTPILPWVDKNTVVHVKYQRATPYWTRAQSEQHAHYDAIRGRSGVSVGKHVVAAPNRATTSDTAGSVTEVSSVPHPTATPNMLVGDTVLAVRRLAGEQNT